MTRRQFTLRSHQAELLDQYDPNEDTLFDQPTGSGKTLEIVTLVGMLRQPTNLLFRNILIAAPQTHIEAGFLVDRDYNEVRWPDGRRQVELPQEMIRVARDGPSGSIEEIHSYLAVPQDFALVTTHTAFGMSNVPRDCSGMLLIIDEWK